jgi:hypothetical protein
MSDPVAIAAQLKQQAQGRYKDPRPPIPSSIPWCRRLPLSTAAVASLLHRYLRNDQKWSLYEDKTDNPQQKLNVPHLSCCHLVSLISHLPPWQIKAAGAAATLIGMCFTGHIKRAYDRSEGDGSVPMLSAFLLFMCLSILCVVQHLLLCVLSLRLCRSKWFTMHVRNWAASAKIRLDEKRKARATEEAADACGDNATAAVADSATDAGDAAGLRRRTGKTKKA